ncbi:hypothetical protein ETB97_006566 [Aspergillus alliaceus]|uniref:Uncharacterized protein n=1 Tax=Petromyces alliaceus TaxID=209559 RepID=A0A5N7BXI4_PETAA|nr:hypothetical protein BDV23DRAFT_140514 [Aspergillus alliaceus]KAF5864721.1 hypothetical protein ETB97_006566 [Aspergillus burnettii]
MECLHGRVSYASWRLRVFRRLFLPSLEISGQRTISRRTITSSTSQNESYPKSQSQPNHDANAKPATDDGTKPLRLSQTLPQSPFMTSVHPQLLKQHKKRTPTHEDLEDLRRNPWAMALASPPRMCSVTAVRVPRTLMSDWGMVQHPDTKELWFLPVGLLKDELSSAARNEPQTGSDSASKPTPEGQNIRHLRLRIVDRLPVLRKMTRALRSSRSKSAVPRLIPFRWKHPHGPLTSREEKQIVWREDMPGFVLSKMRADALKQLKHACRRYKHPDAADGVWTTFSLEEYTEAAVVEGLRGLGLIERMECGAVLVMGILDDNSTATTERESDDETMPHVLGTLPEFVTLPQVQSKVPVFELAQLFSEDELEEIWGFDSRFQSPALVFRPNDKITVNAMLALWKLKGFVRHDPICETPAGSN